jgi:hypothetical protein
LCTLLKTDNFGDRGGLREGRAESIGACDLRRHGRLGADQPDLNPRAHLAGRSSAGRWQLARFGIRTALPSTSSNMSPGIDNPFTFTTPISSSLGPGLMIFADSPKKAV